MIRFENLSKSYRVRGEVKVVIDHLDITLRTGSSLALLGRNGAGKSTLMSIIAGSLRPDTGRVVSDGSISWPVGFAGSFHNQLTGAENVRFLARVYGVDTDELIDFVADFAELGKHFDMPVRTYSAGMRARLTFGASMGIKFDTYLVDEATAVGDAAFRAKSQRYFADRVKNASALLVSHSMDQLREFCDAGIVLADGKLRYFENLEEAIDRHLEDLDQNKAQEGGRPLATAQGAGAAQPSDAQSADTSKGSRTDEYFRPPPGVARAPAELRKAFAAHMWQHVGAEMKRAPDGRLAGTHWPVSRGTSDVYLGLFEAAGVDVAPFRAMPVNNAFYQSMNKVLMSGNATLEADPRTARLVPPEGVHWRHPDPGVLIDLCNCDIIRETLIRADAPLRPGGRYLDFGCSSSPAVRTFWGAYPDMHWVGVDPRPSPIHWAASVLPQIELHVNDLWPPMNRFADQEFDGIHALSTLSDFSALAAVEWLNEMHRLLKPGGFALITCNGYSEILRRLWIEEGQQDHLDPEVLVRAYNGLAASGFHFEPDRESPPEPADQAHGGHTFICRKWFQALEKTGKWRLAHYVDKQWSHKQDIAVLIRQ